MRKLKNKELKRVSIKNFKSKKKIPIILILDNVRSAMNVGSIFRTSDAFLVEKIYLCGITSIPPNKELLKTALGANNSVVWEYVEKTQNIIQSLKNNNYHIVGIEQTTESISLDLFNIPNKKLALIFGHEVFGVHEDVIPLCDQCVEIPQFGTKHSLNISVSAGIVLWDVWLKIKKNS